MAYESKPIRRQKVAYDNANTSNPLTFGLVSAGAKITPASATITIYAPGGTTPLVNAASMTVSGTLLTYCVSTTTEASWPIATGYRAEITITTGTGGSAVTRPPEVVVFDVVRWVLNLGITKDQLVALDDGISGMDHAGDDDLSEVIEACRDELQLLVEMRAVEDGKLVENMILDHSRIAVAARPYILARIWKNHGQKDKGEDYMKTFAAMFKAVMAGVSYDEDQEGEEESEPQGTQAIRLEM
jgi:hypothetical protein